jgi:hypothetical protein
MPDYQILANVIGVMFLITLVVAEMFDTTMDMIEEKQYEELNMSV